MTLEERNKSILDWLESIGYPGADLNTPMGQHISRWQAYIDHSNEFYTREEKDINGKPVDVKVRSCSPAELIDAAMASLIYNEEAAITVPGDLGDEGATNDFLQQWLEDVKWHETAPLDIESMCDLGTIGWALQVNGVLDNGKANNLFIAPISYEAPDIIPLVWNPRGCVVCAFTSMTYINGDEYTQVEVHRPDVNGNYEILSAFFDDSGSLCSMDGYLKPGESIKTGQPTPTFALARLAKRNRYWPRSPMGVSLFDGITDVLETADLAFDSLGNDIILGRKMVGVPESMLRKDDVGRIYTPWHDGRQFFMAQKDTNVYADGKLGVFEYNPSLRSEENREGLSTALQVLGMKAGFGTKYFSLDSQGGITTAKQVASDNADLMRTLRRHEKPVRRAIATIVEAAMGTYANLSTAELMDVRGKVSVKMGDSVIEDTDTMRENDRADVAAGLLEPWEYMVRWQGYTEDDAKAAQESLSTIEGIPL